MVAWYEPWVVRLATSTAHQIAIAQRIIKTTNNANTYCSIFIRHHWGMVGHCRPHSLGQQSALTLFVAVSGYSQHCRSRPRTRCCLLADAQSDVKLALGPCAPYHLAKLQRCRV